MAVLEKNASPNTVIAEILTRLRRYIVFLPAKIAPASKAVGSVVGMRR
jgi:hypothetical protein